ncbi:hypothetical protein [Brucella pituitosa]|uniref:Uncharacterized protein n=1 Tax=Brucella pituitosa TaxID=571256 RepID=A0A643F2Z5_9HYPH|nr:hypothetical protein [Brucella pituitosa]KAB0572620.1 hypothetical protein F7Q93_07310 [Brucella pituitosa]
MLSKFLNRTFTVSDAAWAADVDIETLRSWIKRGKFEIPLESGKWTRLSFANLCQVAAFSEVLASQGNHTLAQFIAEGSYDFFSGIQPSYDKTISGGEVFVLCGREVDGGGNHIGGIIFHDISSLTNKVSSLLSDGAASFSLVSLSAILANVINRLSSMDK